MTLSDSVLLQISQKKTNYNDLLIKMLPNYSTQDSAKAALSRVLKNLLAFGEIAKDSENTDYYVLSDKGKHTVESKLKNKLFININNLLSKTNSLQYIDDIVRHLQLFINKSKTDPTLMKFGKTGSTFYIQDLESLKGNIENNVLHYTQILDLLSKQIDILKEQDFEDVYSINLDESAITHIKNYCLKNNLTDITIDCEKDSPETIKLFINNDKFIKKSENLFIIKIVDIDELKKLLLRNLENTISARFKIYLSDILIKLNYGKLYFYGSFSLVKKLKEEINQAGEVK